MPAGWPYPTDKSCLESQAGGESGGIHLPVISMACFTFSLLDEPCVGTGRRYGLKLDLTVGRNLLDDTHLSACVDRGALRRNTNGWDQIGNGLQETVNIQLSVWVRERRLNSSKNDYRESACMKSGAAQSSLGLPYALCMVFDPIWPFILVAHVICDWEERFRRV